jgi:allophanate hydrolase
VTFFGPAFTDAVVAEVAALLDAGPLGHEALRPPGNEVAVFGAHLTGQPLNHQLAGGRLVGSISTSAGYRLYALSTTPPEPGLVAVGHGGQSIEGELWSLPPTGLAALLVALPRPMALGPVHLQDGRTVVGFACQPDALDGAEDITSWRSWPAYLARR